MNSYFKLVLYLLVLFQIACTSSESVFKLSPEQSMLITGKGPGQDATFNPYGSTRSVAVVRNLQQTIFSVRIEKSDEIVEITEIGPKARVEFVLEPDYELYFDSDQKGQAKITFRRIR